MKVDDETAAQFAEAMEFRETLNAETDRGCALMAASYLDDQLEHLLRSVLVDDAQALYELLRPSGPLGSFSARVEMCYALGRLPPFARRDLNLIRKIRNDFGHVAKPIGFGDSPIADRCREMHHTARESEAPARGHFTNAVMGLAAVLHRQIRIAVRSPIPKDVSLSEEQKRIVREVATEIVGGRDAEEGDA